MKTQDTQEIEGRGKWSSRNEAGHVSLACKIVEQAVEDYKLLEAAGYIRGGRAIWPDTATKIRDSLFMVLIDLEAFLCDQSIALRQLQIEIDHLLNERLEAHLRGPPQLLPSLSRIAEQRVDLGRAEIARVDLHDDSPIGGVSPYLLHTVPAPLDVHAETRACF